MSRNACIGLGLLAAWVGAFDLARAQSSPASGLYQIVSGSYTECCGVAGNGFGYDLPSPEQSFVSFTVNPPGTLAALSFLAADAQTVFSTVPCPLSGPISFSFDYGFVSPGWTWFHVDPGPPPYDVYWTYGVSNAANSLRIDGTLVTLRSLCLDTPTHFSHSNVVAVLVPGPRLTVLAVTKDQGTRLMVQGNAGWTDVVEASTNLSQWTPISTNVMDYSLCPICPDVIVEDPAATNLVQRFYRAFEVP